MKIISLTLRRHRRQMVIAAPPTDNRYGIRVEADSEVPEDEIWFITDDGVQKVRLASEDD